MQCVYRHASNVFSLLPQGDYNVIVTGWKGGSRQIWYPQSASDTKVTGTEVALMVKNLVDYGAAR